jgi:hypothetical protein
MRSFRDRMARLEALEQAHPDAPPYLCIRVDDWAQLDNPTLDPIAAGAILRRYGLTDVRQLQTKVYVGICACSWDDPPGRCPVCEADQQVNIIKE